MKQLSLFILSVSALLFSRSSIAQLALDPSFGESGYVVGDVFEQETYSGVNKTIVQVDKKIIAIGYKGTGVSDVHGYIIRYHDNGAIDSTFGENGVISTFFSPTYDQFRDGCFDSSDNIYLVGLRDNEDKKQQSTIVKYDQNGVLQSSFGEDGILYENFNNSVFVEVELVNNKTKLLAVGQGDRKFLLAQYNLNGSRDLDFGNNGIVQTEHGLSSSAHDMAIQDDGKIIVVGGSTIEGGNVISVIARYHANGLLDKSFGDNGIVTHDFLDVTWADDFVRSVEILGNGDIILAGVTGQSGYSILKLRSTGEFDSSFATNGIMEGDKQTYPIYRNCFAVLENGEMLSIFNTSDINFQTSIYITKYKIDGEIDSAFNINGVVGYSIPNTEKTIALNLSVLPDKKVLLAGYSNEYDKNSSSTLIRLMPWLVGLNEQQKPKFSSLIYPNPIKQGENSVSLKGSFTKPVKVKLYDAQGKLVYKAEVVGINPVLKPPVLNKGLYTLSVDEAYYERLVVQ